MGEIHSVERHSEEVGESKGTCLLKLSLVSGKDTRLFGSEWKLEVESKTSNNPASKQSCLESMENQLS